VFPLIHTFVAITANKADSIESFCPTSRYISEHADHMNILGLSISWVGFDYHITSTFALVALVVVAHSYFVNRTIVIHIEAQLFFIA
jgi:hypothetical protein